MTVRLANRAGLPDARLQALEAELGAPTWLSDVLDWSRRRSPPVRVEEIVTQDEFTHDVLVPLEPPLWLVFDVT